MSVFRSTWSAKVLDLQKKFKVSPYLHTLIHWDIIKLLSSEKKKECPPSENSFYSDMHVWYNLNEKQSYLLENRLTKLHWQNPDVPKLLICRTLQQKWRVFVLAYLHYFWNNRFIKMILQSWFSKVPSVHTILFVLCKKKNQWSGWVPIQRSQLTRMQKIQ